MTKEEYEELLKKQRDYKAKKKLNMTDEEKRAALDKRKEYRKKESAKKANTKALEENRVPSSPTASSSSLTD
jgi:hypothetical protein